MAFLFLIPVNAIDSSLLSYLKEGLEERFDFSFKLTEKMAVPPQAYDPRRKQYHSTIILNYIDEHLPEGTEKVLGVVDVDLYAPGLNFVFGEANLGGRSALISLTRLKQEFYGLSSDTGLFYQRALKEAVHELGHTLGFTHCPNNRCVMHFSNSLEDTDLKLSLFCSKCAKIAAKMKTK